MREDPYRLGEDYTLRSYGRGEKVFITAPSGMAMGIPLPNETYTITLSEIGEWKVEWPNGDEERLQVVRAPDPIELIDQEAAAPPSLPTSGPITTL